MWSEHCSYKSSRVLSQKPADRRAPCSARAGRECRRGRHRRRACGRVQDREPQSSVVHRALPGRGDRRRRHPARYLHHGRAADRLAQFASLRQHRSPAHALFARRRGRRHRRLRQLHRRAHGGRRVLFRRVLQRQYSRQRVYSRRGQEKTDLHRRRQRRRQSGDLRRLEDRPRRHPRRDHGVGVVFRGKRAAPPDRASGRSVHREAAARSLPGADGKRFHRRHPGHGRRGPYELLGGNGRARRRGGRVGSLGGAAARKRHDAL